MRVRVMVFMIGALVAGAGGWSMYSDTMHQLNGKPSTATLIEHIKECTIEYQRVGEDRRKEPMPCYAAEALQRLVGANKIEISSDLFALVRFFLADGRVHEAKVAESKLGSFKLPVGEKIAVVYAPDQPGDVRAVLTWERFKGSLLAFAGGLCFLMLGFADRVAALLAWAFRSRPSAASNEPRPAAVAGGRPASAAMSSGPSVSFGRRK